MPTYDYACTCGAVVEEVRGYDDSVIPCPSCGKSAERVPVYTEQFISGETVAKGRYATRAGNIKDRKGRTRVSLFQEASSEVDYAHRKREQEVGREMPRPDLYKVGLERARRMGVPIR